MNPTTAIIDILQKKYPDLKIQFMDIGAAGGLDEKILSLERLVESYGFEPNPEEFSKLSNTEHVRWINEGVAGSDGPRILHVTQGVTNSSLLEPDPALLEQYEWGGDHQVSSSLQVNCKSLQTICNENRIRLDMLKIDTQGTELEILRGASDGLDATGFLMIEVEFQSIYRNQPLFRDVDAFLAEKNFELVDFGNLLRIKARGTSGRGNMRSRLVSADAIYVKRLDSPQTADVPLLLARFLGLLAYGYVDWCQRSLDAPAYKVFGNECLGQLKRALIEGYPIRRFPELRRLASRVLGRAARIVRPADASYWTDPWV